MAVRSQPLSSRRQSSGCALLLGKAGMWLAVLSFGGIFWAVNGGFSVIGLGVLSQSFNDAGRLFWAAIAQITFRVPVPPAVLVAVPTLPVTQPLIPWIGVVAASCLQISITWLKLSGQSIPIPLLITAVLLSGYDYVTTFFGLMTVPWLVPGGPVPAMALAVPLTFALELAIGYALKKKR